MYNTIQYRNQVEERIYKVFSPLVFEERRHLYWLDDKLIPSVSSKVKDYEYPFDEVKWLPICAKREGKTEHELKHEWQTINKKGCDLGHETHKFMEDYRGYQIPTSPQQEAGVKYIKDLEGKYIISFRELRAFSREHWYAGTMDLPLENIVTGNYVIDDYKTNKDLFKGYGYLKEPFTYLEAHPFNKYQIQLSLYQIMLEAVLAEFGLIIEDRRIVYLMADGNYKIYNLYDFTKELKDYMKYKKAA